MIIELTIDDVLATTKEQVASMSDQKIRDFRIGVALAGSRESSALEESGSPIGQRILQRKLDDLHGLRKEYASIRIGALSDSQVVRALIAKQAGEMYLLADIERMKNKESHSDGVDNVIQMCDDIIAVRERLASSGR